MGASSSAPMLRKHEELLAQLAGPKAIQQQDVFWKQLFMFGAQLAALEPTAVEQVLTPFAQDLLVHSASSHNFQSLVVHTISLLNDARAGKNRRATSNALCLVRSVVKQVVESGSSQQLYGLFDIPPGVPIPQELLNSTGAHQLLRIFVRRLFATVAETEASDATYALLYEAMQTLLVAASTQLYTPSVCGPPHAHPLLEVFHQQAALSPQVVQQLLHLYIHRPPAPASGVWQPPPPTSSSSSTIEWVATRAARSAVATLMWLPMRTYGALSYSAGGTGGGTAADGGVAGGGTLSELSLLLLLLLVHQPDVPPGSVNPFKYSLYNLQDEAEGGDPEGGQAAGVSSRYAHVRFSELHSVLAGPGGLVDEPSCLLLYDLLHGCKSFQDYTLSRMDLEALVLPVLKLLYHCPRTSPNHMYMLQVLLLILSQDNSFSQNVHKLIIPSVPWYKEQVLSSVPLGSLVFIVLLRTVAAHCGHRRDLFLPTNALAAVANMAPHVAKMGSVAAQRLVGLLQTLSRRYNKLSTGLAMGRAPSAMTLTTDASASSSAHTQDDESELAVLEEFLRILLEVVTAILLPAVQRNLELLYALLHRQETLVLLRGHPRLGPQVHNLQLVVDFFNKRLDDAKSLTPNADWSVSRVLELVTASAPFWRPDGIVSFPEQRFVYEEEEHSEEFFVPYIWQLVTAHTLVPWRLQTVRIFAPAAAAAPAAVAPQGDAPLQASAAVPSVGFPHNATNSSTGQ